MSWWMFIPAALSAAGSISGYVSSNRQNSAQRQLNQYNANMQYQTDMANAKTGLALAGVNAAMTQMAGKLNAAMVMHSANLQMDISSRIAEYNMGVITATSLYNDSLFEDELTNLWEAMDLDLALLENQRAVERGEIEAFQAASGAVMGEGSLADVIIDQQTQAALDANVVRFNADQQARQIQNARAKGLWEGQMQIHKIAYEGLMGNILTESNARLQAASSIGQAGLQSAAIMGQANIQSIADRYNARQNYQANLYNVDARYNQQKTAISNQLITGLFNSASLGTATYFMQKQPTLPSATAVSTATRSASTLARQSHPAWERVLQGQLTQSGSSLM